MIEFHNPEADGATEPIPYDLSVKVRGADVDLGLLANGFPDSGAFLDHLGDALRALEPGIRIHRFDKANPTMPADGDLLENVAAASSGVIAAYGH